MTVQEHDLIAVGGGTAGLVSAAGAAYLGVRPALVERAALGGDCLWTGCVPSKALLASARLAHAMRNAESLGLKGAAPTQVFCSVMERMRQARERVAHHDDPERFRKMGVHVHFGTARFIGADTLDVEGVGTLKSKRIIVATGARPAIPPIPGLEEAGYQTHETIFDLERHPARVGILGGGPIGLEFSQVFGRLGSEVVVLEMLDRILPSEDPDVAEALLGILRREGIDIELSSRVVAVQVEGARKVILTEDGRRFPSTRSSWPPEDRPIPKDSIWNVQGSSKTARRFASIPRCAPRTAESGPPVTSPEDSSLPMWPTTWRRRHSGTRSSP